MYKILLADNEGVVLDSLIHIIYGRFGESCDIRTAKTARQTRALARKFIPDIAVINIQMPGMHGFDIVREIRSYHIKCVFITVSSYGKSAYQSEARGLNTLAHLTKPLFREKILPTVERAVSIVSQSHMRMEQTQRIQEKFDAVVPILEHGLISQMFFPQDAAQNIARYRELLDISQNYCRAVTLTFGEPAAEEPRRGGASAKQYNPAEPGASAEQRGLAEPGASAAQHGPAERSISIEKDALQNAVGSAVHLQKNYLQFREIVRESFPLAIVGPVMGNHVLFLLPYWHEEETAREKKEFSQALAQMLDALEGAIERLSFRAEAGPIRRMEELRL